MNIRMNEIFTQLLSPRDIGLTKLEEIVASISKFLLIHVNKFFNDKEAYAYYLRTSKLFVKTTTIESSN